MSMSKGFYDFEMNDNEYDRRGATIVTAIFRSIEQADSLIDILAQRCEEDEEMENMTGGMGSNVLSPNRQAEDDAIIIREIKHVNMQLRNLIAELLSQLEAKDRKVLMLRERLAQLEAEVGSLDEDVNTDMSSSNSSADSHSKGGDEE